MRHFTDLVARQLRSPKRSGNLDSLNLGVGFRSNPKSRLPVWGGASLFGAADLDREPNRAFTRIGSAPAKHSPGLAYRLPSPISTQQPPIGLPGPGIAE